MLHLVPFCCKSVFFFYVILSEKTACEEEIINWSDFAVELSQRKQLITSKPAAVFPAGLEKVCLLHNLQ